MGTIPMLLVVLTVGTGLVNVIRGQDRATVATSSLIPLIFVALVYGTSNDSVDAVLLVATIAWLFMFSFSERVGQAWWKWVLRREVESGCLPGPDNFLSRRLEDALAPAWATHKRYLRGHVPLSQLLSSYRAAKDKLKSVTPTDREWENVLASASSYVDAMIDHLSGGQPDFEPVHKRHDALRDSWKSLVDRRRRPWRPFEFF